MLLVPLLTRTLEAVSKIQSWKWTTRLRAPFGGGPSVYACKCQSVFKRSAWWHRLKQTGRPVFLAPAHTQAQGGSLWSGTPVRV